MRCAVLGWVGLGWVAIYIALGPRRQRGGQPLQGSTRYPDLPHLEAEGEGDSRGFGPCTAGYRVVTRLVVSLHDLRSTTSSYIDGSQVVRQKYSLAGRVSLLGQRPQLIYNAVLNKS
jgi:hypothetical protein